MQNVNNFRIAKVQPQGSAPGFLLIFFNQLLRDQSSRLSMRKNFSYSEFSGPYFGAFGLKMLSG